jgi:hypothetical protein
VDGIERKADTSAAGTVAKISRGSMKETVKPDKKRQANVQLAASSFAEMFSRQ